MKIFITENPTALGRAAAAHTAQSLRSAIEKNGSARLVLSTGASQLDTIAALVTEDVDWSRVEMFHLDEYVDLPETHIASFRKYLRERFVNVVHPAKAYLVDGTAEGIRTLTDAIREREVDVALIGIGENAHIAFNDPPADFNTQEAYMIVNLDERCKRQQVGEGWFATVDDVPKQAVTMTVHQIMRSREIISCVPYAVKAQAIADTLHNTLTNRVPATMLKEHPRFFVFVDRDSAAGIDEARIVAGSGGFDGIVRIEG